jgi:CRP-like cAMP-binding protein
MSVRRLAWESVRYRTQVRARPCEEIKGSASCTVCGGVHSGSRWAILVTRIPPWFEREWRYFMPGSHDPRENHLLAAFSSEERDRLYQHLQLVPMPLGEVLYEPGDVLRHVYFPTDSIVSLLYVLADGASAEISVVGNEGLIGIALFMGGETTPSRAIVQSAGHAYRLIGQRLKDEFHRNGELQLLLLRYTQALITQMAQTAVCNRHHSVDQQLCRWLLLSLDRLSSNQLTMTQELIANMLGVRRQASPRPPASWTSSVLSATPVDHGSGPAKTGTAVLRVLCRGQEGSDRLLPPPRRAITTPRLPARPR